MMESKPTRDALLKELADFVDAELKSNQGLSHADRMRRKVLLEKKALLSQMND